MVCVVGASYQQIMAVAWLLSEMDEASFEEHAFILTGDTFVVSAADADDQFSKCPVQEDPAADERVINS